MIYPTCGLYREFYHPSPELLISPEKIKTSLDNLDANSLFWCDVFSDRKIKEVTTLALEHYSNLGEIPISIKAAVSDPLKFVARVLEARVHVVDQGLSPRKFFSYLETLNIYCAVYASTVTEYKIPFTVQGGWMLEEDSSIRLFDTCLDSTQNPYLIFIQEVILPIVEKANPKVVFFVGRPGYFSFALARLLKVHLPTIFTCITRHSSEYYSLNKIDNLLVQNSILFKIFDGVILEHFEETEKSIVTAVSKHKDLQSIHNLIYKTYSTPHHTGYHVSEQTMLFPKVEIRPKITSMKMTIPPCSVANVHLFPYVKCYWNQCSFCGINKKYHFENPDETYCYLERQLENMSERIEDVSHIWFIDEALPPDVLKNIAIFFAEKMKGVSWQARCRIERDLLTENLPAILAASGLHELRLGLESGSTSVLKNMNKFDDSFSFELVEEICKQYTSRGISIHFPIIIGFPGESDADRRETYHLLRDLINKYPKVTFNINLFGLDIGSRVFMNWHNYEISSIDFPCDPKYFIGNTLKWQHLQRDELLLAIQRDQFMRAQLYPWMPARAMTPPHIFYRLSETIRDTLFWKERALWPEQNALTHIPLKAQVGDLTIIYDRRQEVYYIYNWSSHHYMLGNTSFVDLLQRFETPCNISDALDIFRRTTSCPTSVGELKSLIRRLLYEQFLLPCD